MAKRRIKKMFENQEYFLGKKIKAKFWRHNQFGGYETEMEEDMYIYLGSNRFAKVDRNGGINREFVYEIIDIYDLNNFR